MNIYVGFDSTNYGQELAYEVCRRSILDNTSGEVNIIPLVLQDFKDAGIFWRPHDPGQSTEFTYTRFLVPYLNGYQDRAVFCDSDFLWKCDVMELLDFLNEEQAVSCVQHSYKKCRSSTKMDGLKQEWYPRKNWSSLMIFNCSHDHCKLLDLDAINSQSPKYLHRMNWTEDSSIGSIPVEYNYLVGYYNHIDRPKVFHFTDGGPWHRDYRGVKYGGEWLEYLDDIELEVLNESFVND